MILKSAIPHVFVAFSRHQSMVFQVVMSCVPAVYRHLILQGRGTVSELTGARSMDAHSPRMVPGR